MEGRISKKLEVIIMQNINAEPSHTSLSKWQWQHIRNFAEVASCKGAWWLLLCISAEVVHISIFGAAMALKLAIRLDGKVFPTKVIAYEQRW